MTSYPRTHRIYLRILWVLSIVCASSNLLAHQGHVDDAATTACQNKTLSSQCSYQNSHRDLYKGYCRSIMDKMTCVRNQPIEKYRHVAVDEVNVEKLKKTSEPTR